MVNIPFERLPGLIVKWGRAIAKSEDATDEPETEEATAPTDTETESMPAYWETDKEERAKKKETYFDSFLKDVALDRIPDTTPKPIVESRYDFDRLSLVFLPNLKNLNVLQPAGTVTPVIISLVSN